MNAWGHQFLAVDRVAERERTLHETARIQRLLGRDLPAVRSGGSPVSARRALARAIAGMARVAWAAARRLDPEVRARA